MNNKYNLFLRYWNIYIIPFVLKFFFVRENRKQKGKNNGSNENIYKKTQDVPVQQFVLTKEHPHRAEIRKSINV